MEQLRVSDFVDMYEPELLTRVNDVMRRDAEYFTDEYSEEIEQMSGRCIDIGTGAGDVSVDFILPKLKPNSTLLCSDISEAMVNHGKKIYGNNERLSFMVLNIETPELPRDLVGQFDHLTSLYCLHWCDNLRLALENMYRLLRPGGSAFVTFLSNHSGLAAFADLKATPKYQNYIKDADRLIPPFQHVERPRKAVMTLLNDVGFRVTHCSCRSLSYVFDTTDYLSEFLLAISPFDTVVMPADLRAEYKRDVVNAFMDREIVFNKDRNKGDEFSVLCRYRAFVLCMKKPLNK